MKKSLLLIAAVSFGMLLSACSEETVKEIKESSEKPSVEVTAVNNIFDVTTGKVNGTIKSNVNIIAGNINTSGCQMTASSNQFAFSSDNQGNTFDAVYCLMLDFSNGTVWYDYGSYGFVETPVCFRVRGAKGTLAPTFDEKTDNPTTTTYYITGVVTEIKDLAAADKKFTNTSFLASYFKDWGYTIVDTYKADVVALTVKMADNNVITVNVYGKQRDNEIAGLKNYIKTGDTVEFPAYASSAKDLAAKKINDILFCQVLKIK